MTAKTLTRYICQSCGASQPRWLGKCPACGEWNTLAEEVVSKSAKGSSSPQREVAVPKVLGDLKPDSSPRMLTAIAELDRVLGGGFVAASSVLVGGDPGVGKSTLLLQTAASLANSGQGVLYVTAEEAPAQLRMRADRLQLKSVNFQVLGESDLTASLDWARKLKPSLVVVDSIQTLRHPELDSAPGTVSQVREVASAWTDWAKQTGSTVALVGHVTKEGAIAGPRVVEHLVDAVLLFEGDHAGGVRILRTLKNRFGPTGELGVFEMTGGGLIGVADPSRLFLSERDADTPGVAVAPVIRGSRPLLIEVQALVSRSYFQAPQRNATGVDPRRLALWIAVLEKRVGLGLAGQDVFLNATGGLRLEDAAADLAACSAIASSLLNRPVDQGLVLLGEIGLAGEVRAVSALDRRLAEVAHMKFKQVMVPAAGWKGKAPKGLKVTPVKTLEEAVRNCLGEIKATRQS